MKKMNVIPLIMSLFLVFSCAKQEQIELNSVELESNKVYQEEGQLSVTKFISVGLKDKINYLNCKREFYQIQLEEGNEEYIAIDEETAGIVEYLTEVDNRLEDYSIIRPKRPPGCGPIPPPSPCEPKKEYSLSLREVGIRCAEGFIIPKEFNYKYMEFYTQNNEFIGRLDEFEEYTENELMLPITIEYEGLAFARSTFVLNGEEITIETLVRI